MKTKSIIILITIAFNVKCQTNYNRESLKDWDASINKNNLTIVNWYGDSWTSQANVQQPIADYLRAKYGDAGVGYCGTNSLTTSSGFNSILFPTTKTVTSGWVNISQKKWILSSNISADSSSTTNDSITFTSKFNKAYIHYMQKTGGGTFVYRIDGTNPTTVTTSGTNSLITIPTFTVLDGLHKISIKVLTPNVVVCGVDLTLTKGVRVNNLGVAGSKLSDWILLDSLTFANSLNTFSPNLIVISLGVNDCRSNIKPEIVVSNLNTFINRIFATLPNASICFFTQSDIGDITTYPFSYYINQIKDFAISKNISFINNYDLIGAFAQGNSRGLYQDNQHINSIGGRIFKDNFIDYLHPLINLEQDIFSTTHFHSNTASGAGIYNNLTYHYDKSFVGITVASGGTGTTKTPAFDCVLTGFSMNSYIAGTIGSSENVSVFLRVNNSYDIPLTTVAKVNSTINLISDTNLNFDVPANSNIEIKVVVPTMSVVPTNITENVTLYFKKK